MGAEAGFKRAIRGIVNKCGIVGAHGEERRIPVDQGSPEALVDSRLVALATVKVIGCVEWIMRFCHVIGEYGCVQFCLFPLRSEERRVGKASRSLWGCA